MESRRFLDEENWLYCEEIYSGIGVLWRIGHNGDHRFKDGQCPCGVLDLGVVE